MLIWRELAASLKTGLLSFYLETSVGDLQRHAHLRDGSQKMEARRMVVVNSGTNDGCRRLAESPLF